MLRSFEILTQPDNEGLQYPVAYESRKLTAAERNYPAHVLELLAVVHALLTFWHYLLFGEAPRPAVCWSTTEDLKHLRDVEKMLLQRRLVHQTVVHVHQRAPFERCAPPTPPREAT